MRRLSAALLALVCLVVPALRAQSFPVDDPVLRRIWSLGMDSSHTESLAQVLFDSIGPRMTGTAQQKSGNDWLVRTYARWGIEAKNEKTGTWRGWRRGYSHIDLVAPRVRSLEGTMLGFSPGTGGKPLTARPIILPRFADSTEFVRWLPKARGRLILVSAPQPTCRAMDDWTAQATPASKERMDSLRARVKREWANPDVRGTGYSLALGTGELGLRLEAAGVAGIITSRPKDAWGTIEIFDTYDKTAPAVALSCEDYGLVYRLTENNQGPMLRLDLDAQRLPERPIFNTIATIPGELANEYVMFSAHFDSWDGSSGATDNGTGTIMMMEAMRILKQVYPKPHRTILVGHWTSEENGLVGSRAFSEDHPEVLEGMMVLMNQDNGTGRVVRMGAGGLPNAARHVEQWLGKLPTELRQQINFAGAGTPRVAGAMMPPSPATACRPSASAVRDGATGITPGTPTAIPTTRSSSTICARMRRWPRCSRISPRRIPPASRWAGWIWPRSPRRPRRRGRARAAGRFPGRGRNAPRHRGLPARDSSRNGGILYSAERRASFLRLKPWYACSTSRLSSGAAKGAAPVAGFAFWGANS